MIPFHQKNSNIMDNKNLILAITLSVGILLLWSILFEAPPIEDPSINTQSSEISKKIENKDISADFNSFDVGESSVSSSDEIVSIDESLQNSKRIGLVKT